MSRQVLRRAAQISLIGLAASSGMAQEVVLFSQDVHRFRVAGSSSHAAVSRWVGEDTFLESVRLDDAQLNLLFAGPDPYGRARDEFVLTPSGSRVVFPVRGEVFGVARLLSIGLEQEPNQAVDLTDGLPTGNGVETWSISRDGAFVVFTWNPDGGEPEVYAVPVGGPASARWRLNADLPFEAQAGVVDLVIAEDSSRVFYLADQVTPGDLGIWSVPLVFPAPTPALVSRTSSEGWQCLLPDVPELDPTSISLFHPCTAVGNAGPDLFLSPAAGGSPPERLHPPIAANQYVEEYFVNPTGEWAVFALGGAGIPWGNVLYRAGPAGNPDLWSPLSPAGPGLILEGNWSLSLDGSRVLYQYDEDTSFRHDLYSVPVTGTPADNVRLSPETGANDRIVDFALTYDPAWILFGLRLDGLDTIGYRVPTDGSNPPEPIWTQPCLVWEGKKLIQVTPDGEFAVVRCAKVTSTRAGLGLVRIAGAVEPEATELLSDRPFLSSYGGDEQFEVTTDGRWVLFLGIESYPADSVALYGRRIPFFRDGFESSGASNWSSSQP